MNRLGVSLVSRLLMFVLKVSIYLKTWVRTSTVVCLEADAYRKSEEIRGDGDAIASSTYAEAFNQDAEFYSFTRSLKAYTETFSGKDDVLLLKPDSDFFKYMKNPNAK